MQKLTDFLGILRSPHTGKPLKLVSEELVGDSGERFPVVNGIPVLVRQIEPMHTTPPQSAKISQNIAEYVVAPQYASARRILHLGSGDVPCKDPRVISLDVLPCENVDIVAEAEYLPFADDSFDLIESGAVFEHLYDPIKAIAEVRRVLAPGGKIYIDNSFLQPYHGFPGHYYAMTPQANETFLVDDLVLEESTIPESGTPITTLVMFMERFLSNLPKDLKAATLKQPVGKFLDDLRKDPTSKGKFMQSFSEHEKRSMAATHVVIATKPKDYSKNVQKLQKTNQTEEWASLKRQYYTLRTELMLRHHETLLYRRFCREEGKGKHVDAIPVAEAIKDILKRYILTDPHDIEALTSTIQEMQEEETKLRQNRDALIGVFTS